MVVSTEQGFGVVSQGDCLAEIEAFVKFILSEHQFRPSLTTVRAVLDVGNDVLHCHHPDGGISLLRSDGEVVLHKVK